MTQQVSWDTLTTHVPEDAQIFLADVCRAEDQPKEAEDADSATADGKERGSFHSARENVYEVDEEGNKVLTDLSYSDPQHLELYRHVRLPTLRYDKVGLRATGRGAVLVIGGEVGLSNSAKKFVADNFGSKVTVPLANGMDSLNVGVAAGIILYEMQKQLHEIAMHREKEHLSGG